MVATTHLPLTSMASYYPSFAFNNTPREHYEPYGPSVYLPPNAPPPPQDYRVDRWPVTSPSPFTSASSYYSWLLLNDFARPHSEKPGPLAYLPSNAPPPRANVYGNFLTRSSQLSLPPVDMRSRIGMPPYLWASFFDWRFYFRELQVAIIEETAAGFLLRWPFFDPTPSEPDVPSGSGHQPQRRLYDMIVVRT